MNFTLYPVNYIVLVRKKYEPLSAMNQFLTKHKYYDIISLVRQERNNKND